MEKRRPIGLTIFGIIFILFGLWGILKLTIYTQQSISSGFFLTERLLSNICLWFLPFIQALFLVLSFALFKRANWTPIGAVILAVLQGLCYIYWLPIMLKATTHFDFLPLKAIVIDTLSMLIIIGFQVYIIYFFIRPKVKEYFK